MKKLKFGLIIGVLIAPFYVLYKDLGSIPVTRDWLALLVTEFILQYLYHKIIIKNDSKT